VQPRIGLSAISGQPSLYIALVPSVDEKSQILALDRIQPGVPLKKGSAGTMTHDYKRNGVTTLFAALVAAKAKSVTQMQAGEVMAKGFLRFLKKIDATVARHLDVHVVCDNYRTHKTKEVQAWLAKHPRFKMHYTPTSSSWLNLVERLFAEISRKQNRARRLQDRCGPRSCHRCLDRRVERQAKALQMVRQGRCHH
jgi:transposase